MRLAILLLLVITTNICAQNIKYQTCKTEWFSVILPSTWKFIADTSISIDEYTGQEKKEVVSGRFISKDSMEAPLYADCYDGLIFYVDVYNATLDSILKSDYLKKDGKYYTTFPQGTREVDLINGKHWEGIHTINSCRIYCKEDDVEPLVEGCETLYFSNDKWTIHFYTSGRAFDDEVLKTMISTFKIIAR